MSDTEELVASDYGQDAELWALLRPGRIAPQKWRRAGKARWHKHIDDTFTSDESKYLADYLYHAAIKRYEEHLREPISINLIGRRDGMHTGYYVVAPLEDASLPRNATPQYGLSEESGEAFDELPEEDREPTVRLSGLLKAGAVAVALLCVLSLLIWTIRGIIIVEPPLRQY